MGGLSGAPVREQSTHIVKVLAAELAGRLPIIAAGGITEGQHAAEKIAAGASLVQLYSGFIYKGPALIRRRWWWPMRLPAPSVSTSKKTCWAWTPTARKSA